MKTSPTHTSPAHPPASRASRTSPLLAALPLAALLLAPPAGAQTLPGAVALDVSRPPPQTVMAYPLPAGRVEAAVARIDGIVADLMRRTGVPGVAVAVVHEGRPLLVKGYGVRKAGENVPVDADTVFQLASLSKAVGASVVAHEVARGTVKWDTPVQQVLPWFTLKDPWVSAHVTIADLYSHRSGLPDHAGDELEDMGYDRRQVMERLRELPLAPFRASYAYTNFGLTSAAEAVAVAAGTDWQSLSEERLYKPLGMAATSSRFADFMARPNRAIPHVRQEGAFVAKYQRDPAAQSPAGGVSSSARDMALWLGFVLGGARDETLAKALLPAMRPETISSPAYAADARSGFYGFGFGAGVSPSGRVMLDHSGAFLLGAATHFVLLPTDRLGIVTLTNAQPVGLAEAIGISFMDLVQFGEVTRDWLTAYQALIDPMYTPLGTLAGKAPPANPAPAQPLAAYEGTYGNAYFGDATVRAETLRTGDGALVLSVGPKPRRFTLAHWSGDTFIFRPEGMETAPPGSVSQVTFADGRMRVEYLDENGLGTFVRR